jgi:hypothetical protein
MQTKSDSMKKKIILIIFIAIILSLPIILRFSGGNNYLPGEAVYSYLLNEKNDNYFFSATSFIVSKTPFDILRIIPLLLLLTSLFILSKILKKLNFNNTLIFIFLLAFSLSPLSQSLAFFFNEMIIVLPFFLLGVFLFLKKKIILGTIPLILTSLIGPEHAIVNFLTVLMIKKYFYKNKKINYSAAIFLFLFILPTLPFLFEGIDYLFKTKIEIFFSEFGSFFGFGLFEFTIAFFGFFILLFEKNKKILLTTSGLIIFFSILIIDLRLYSLIIITAINSKIIYHLYQKKWNINWLKQIVLITIFCGLLFSSISHAIIMSDAPPSSKTIQGLLVLSKKDPGIILTDKEYDSFSRFISKQEIFPKKEISPEEMGDYLNILHSTDMKETEALLKKYSIKYIFITQEMKTGKIWTKEDSGLLLLIQNKKKFKEIIKNEKIEIWEVIYEKKN